MKTDSLNLEIWDRLLARKSLDSIGLPVRSGRLDLSGLKLPDPLVLKEFISGESVVREVDPSLTLCNIELRDLDFSNSSLVGIRLQDCKITNCCFDGCDLQKMRMWSTNVCDSSFVKANFRRGALGGIKDGRWNIFRNVDFSKSDLRNTTYTGAEFNGCLFLNSRIRNVDFNASCFSQCVFEGELRDVLFYNIQNNIAKLPVNTMQAVDMSRAVLRYVEFRNIDMCNVILPDDDDHVIVEHFYSMLESSLEQLSQEKYRSSRKLVAYLSVYLKWAKKNQKIGVINLKDIEEIAGMEGRARICDLLGEK